VSQENVEIVRALYDAFERGDREAPFGSYAADIEVDWSHGTFGGIYRGHDGVREAFRDLRTAFSSMSFTPEELVGVGDRVLATVRERYTGRGSGVAVDRLHYAVWTLRNGEVTGQRSYLDKGEALEAVGLPE